VPHQGFLDGPMACHRECDDPEPQDVDQIALHQETMAMPAWSLVISSVSKSHWEASIDQDWTVLNQRYAVAL